MQSHGAPLSEEKTWLRGSASFALHGYNQVDMHASLLYMESKDEKNPGGDNDLCFLHSTPVVQFRVASIVL